ncbi:MAG: hypothetical protein NC331_03010 [Lachnospiraceae bacterium]|nr:hypothetical protein [Lachnospiraceae bacterium]MCM1238337.1 hypothetical protein [Lachnospiraceae bacterium]
MSSYEKPIVLANEELAEGVYAASGAVISNSDGSNGRPGCDSKYMAGIYQHYQGGWNNTVKEHYGCIGCPAYREEGCGLQIDQAYLDGATSYDVDNGKRMPTWESEGFAEDHMVNDENGLAY